MTASSVFGIRPGWVSDQLFPFESRFFESPSGRMHYVDEGDGEAIVFVHGNPSWSFEFRGVIDRLRGQFRCVAADHIGFGLSERSQAPEDHRPQAHASNFASLLDHLQLREVSLYLTDWGGPIGLDFARRYPDRVRRLILANTWCWPVNTDRHFVMFSRMMSSPVGRFPQPAAQFLRHPGNAASRWRPQASESGGNVALPSGSARPGVPPRLRRPPRPHHGRHQLARFHMARQAVLHRQTFPLSYGATRTLPFVHKS